MKYAKRLSGITFGVLFLYQILMHRYLFENMSLTGLSVGMLADGVITFGLAALAVYLFAGEKLTNVSRRAIGFGAVLYLVFIMCTYNSQLGIVSSGLSYFSTSAANSPFSCWCVIAVKEILLILGTYLALVPDTTEDEEMEAAEEAAAEATTEPADAVAPVAAPAKAEETEVVAEPKAAEKEEIAESKNSGVYATAEKAEAKAEPAEADHVTELKAAEKNEPAEPEKSAPAKQKRTSSKRRTSKTTTPAKADKKEETKKAEPKDEK